MRIMNRLFATAAVVVLLTGVYGCPKKAEVSSSPDDKVQVVAPATPAPSVDEAAKAAEAAAAAKAAEEAQARERAAAGKGGLQPVYFDYDRSTVRSDAVAVLRANAEWLKANPNVKIRIEGNCDERGTAEYNQVLGQRRASSARKYLAGLGVAATRISLLSYGKEKPACGDSSEDCWQRNRRDDFIVVAD